MNKDVFRKEYRKLSPAESEGVIKTKELADDFYQVVFSFGSSREISIALTKIEEAVMWATKHLTK